MRPTEAGELELAPLARKRTHRMKAADSGLYRWYNDHRLPEHIGGGQITVRLHQNEADRKRKFNRIETFGYPALGPRLPAPLQAPERLRIALPVLGGPLFLGWAHSLGWRRQQVEMIGWAVMVNTLTMARHRAAGGLEAAA